MPRHVEPLNGGLVTARDPAVLAIGEMSVMQNAIYLPGNQAPQRAAGRASFGAVAATATPIRGLRNLQFDNGDHFLLAMQGVTLSTALVGDTGTFASCATYAASGAALDAIQFNDEWFLFGGVAVDAASASSNLVAYASGTAGNQGLQFRSHGLAPNMVQVTAGIGTGAWTAGVTGYFEYWFTEIFEYVHDGVTSRLEGTFTGKPFTLFVSSTALQASITIPGAPSAQNAQKWILYRGGPKVLATDQEFPTGFKLAEGEFGTTNTVVDGGTVTSSFVAANATANSGFASLSNPTNIFASDNLYAQHHGILAGGVAAAFPTFAVTEPIVGIEVSVEGHRNTDGNFMTTVVDISGDGGATWSGQKVVPFPLSNNDSTHTIGSPTDLWGLNWTAGSLVAGRFLVRLKCYGTQPKDIFIDQVRARITSAGSAPLDESKPFPAIVISAAGVDAAVGSHGQPPLATTGDIFQGCLVTNSLRTATNGSTEKSFIRYSLPDQPDYFPDPYYLDFETADNDQVTNLKTLNNRLGVFLRSRHYRVNYLPTEADSDFNRGVCREEVSSQYGCVNAMCAAVFEGAGGQSEIAFVSDNNIHATNLFTTRLLADDLDWRSVIATANSACIALVNNREKQELLFYFKNATSGVEHYKCLHLSYNVHHLRPGGRLKISGPVHLRNSGAGQFSDLYAAWAVQRSAGNTDIFLGYGGATQAATAASAGHVFREQATASPAYDSNMKLRGRRMYLASMGSEFRLERVFVYVASGNQTQDITVTPFASLTNTTAAISLPPQTRTWAGESLFELSYAASCEGLELQVEQTNNNQGHFAPQMLVCDWTDFGVEDSGKS